MRIAAAPISWGVCEVPGWGAVLDPARVLASMARLGLSATELGPPGWLPQDPAELTRALGEAGESLVAGFLAVPLHLPGAADGAAASIEALAGAGATTLVLAAATGVDGYDARPTLDAAQWDALLAGADAVAALAAEHGLVTVLHPHVGTLVESAEEIDAFASGSAVDLCLDTGHVLAAGGDPVAVARRWAGRIGHVHVKDVDADLAAQTAAGRLSYTEAVRAGLYRPLGEGDVDLAGVVAALGPGYDGWWVLEQDVMLGGDTDAHLAAAEADVATSLAALRALAPRVDPLAPTPTSPART